MGSVLKRIHAVVPVCLYISALLGCSWGDTMKMSTLSLRACYVQFPSFVYVLGVLSSLLRRAACGVQRVSWHGMWDFRCM